VAKPSRKIKDMSAEVSPSPTASALSPLRHAVFCALWIASIVSNIGSWMQDVSESWLMTSLTLSPVLVALVDTAGILPVVLAALPAGALADIVEPTPLVDRHASLDVDRGDCDGLMALTVI
jgi:hypothetical protein